MTPASPAPAIPRPSVQARPFQCAVAAPSGVAGPPPPTAQALVAEVAATPPGCRERRGSWGEPPASRRSRSTARSRVCRQLGQPSVQPTAQALAAEVAATSVRYCRTVSRTARAGHPRPGGAVPVQHQAGRGVARCRPSRPPRRWRAETAVTRSSRLAVQARAGTCIQVVPFHRRITACWADAAGGADRPGAVAEVAATPVSVAVRGPGSAPASRRCRSSAGSASGRWCVPPTAQALPADAAATALSSPLAGPGWAPASSSCRSSARSAAWAEETAGGADRPGAVGGGGGHAGEAAGDAERRSQRPAGPVRVADGQGDAAATTATATPAAIAALAGLMCRA